MAKDRNTEYAKYKVAEVEALTEEVVKSRAEIARLQNILKPRELKISIKSKGEDEVHDIGRMVDEERGRLVAIENLTAELAEARQEIKEIKGDNEGLVNNLKEIAKLSKLFFRTCLFKRAEQEDAGGD